MTLDDINTYLTAQSIVGGATGWTMALSYMPPSPDKIVYAIETGSEKDPDTTHYYPGFQIIVRGTAQDPETARTKAEAVFTSLHNATISSSYIYVFAKQNVIDIGLDENDRPMFSINFHMMKSIS